jgi:hypothetical protein
MAAWKASWPHVRPASVRATPDGPPDGASSDASTLWNATDKPGVFKAVDGP